MNKNGYRKFIYFLPAAFIVLLGCNRESVMPTDSDNTPQLRPLSLAEKKLVNASNDFAFNILKEVNQNETNKNLFISPLSISTAISMVQNGAAGTTKDEIKEMLGLAGLEDDDINQGYKDLHQLLTGIDKKTEISIANSVWYRQKLTLKEDFQLTIESYYDGAIKPLDFTDPNAKETINKWVEEKTADKIKDLIKEVRDDHAMFLINAIYFKGTWTYEFDKKATKPGDFHKADGSTVMREMMFSDKLRFLHAQDEEARLIQLPYGNEQFYMSILLPHEGLDINDYISSLTSQKIQNLIEKVDTVGYHLYLPKFKLEYEIELNQPLKNLGMIQAFENNADFYEIFSDPIGVKVDKVNHKTFIEVDEEGTTAAAATSVEMTFLSATPRPPSPIVLRVNRPFVILITEKSTENILFAGKILDPKEK